MSLLGLKQALTQTPRTMAYYATIEGAFTYVSTTELSSKFQDAFERALEIEPEQVFTVDLRFNFVDSNAKLLILQMLKAFKHIHTSSEQCNICVEWVSPENDSDLSELGMIAQETSSLPFAFKTV